MDQTLLILFGVTVSPWKIVGWTGVFLFSARWIVQLHASRKHRRVTMPRAFWVLSVAGSLMCLAYFIFGKNDSVGILSNLFPFTVALYNLYLDVTHKRRLDGEKNGSPA